MPQHTSPLFPKCPHILHGGDYNPDQWLHMPEILAEDLRLMKLAHCNAMSVGIFAWSALEPREGYYQFDWLDRVLDNLAANEIYAVLATPSGSKPAWMSKKYPEVCRVRQDGIREHHQGRHNHCRTSPVYREKCVAINTRLAERYKSHPSLLLWHVSNEYCGQPCFCEHCLQAFRTWLRDKYDDNLDQLNKAWWGAFWSHSFSDWDEIVPPDIAVQGMMLDWKRFTTHQTIDFFRTESAPLRAITPDIPLTTNFMEWYEPLNYAAFADELDIISWDSYPCWHDTGDDVAVAAKTAFSHDLFRSMKQGKPFMLMESVPSIPSRFETHKRKRPGMHMLSSLQAVAHGADTVQYFQWRKGRGGCEKFHGAVVDHAGTEHTRVFKDVADVGKSLASLDKILGSTVPAEVALLHDWENRWAVEQAIVLGHNTEYPPTCLAHYRPFWNMGIPVDVIDQSKDLAPYKLVIAPMLFLLKDGMADKLKTFVNDGGTLVMTYWSGIVDENDLCFLGGTPGGGLREVFDIWDEELDSLQPFDKNGIEMCADNPLGFTGRFEARELCSLIHAEGATILATYTDDFYAGRPALTVNDYGKGQAYFIAARTKDAFLQHLYEALIEKRNIKPILNTRLPAGVSAHLRAHEEVEYVFLMNFTTSEQTVKLDTEDYQSLLDAQPVRGSIPLPPYGVSVLSRKRIQ